MNDATYDGPNYRCGACSSGNWNLCGDRGCVTQMRRSEPAAQPADPSPEVQRTKGGE